MSSKDERIKSLQEAFRSHGITSEMVADFTQRKIETVRKYLNDSSRCSDGFLTTCEAMVQKRVSPTAAHAPDSLGSYPKKQMEALVGRYQLIRPAFGSMQWLAATDFNIYWDTELPGLKYSQPPLDPKFPWKVGGKISYLATAGAYHFIEEDNAWGRYHCMTVRFINYTRTFRGISIALSADNNSPFGMPVVIFPWDQSRQLHGSVSMDHDAYPDYKNLLRHAAYYCTTSLTLRCDSQQPIPGGGVKAEVET